MNNVPADDGDGTGEFAIGFTPSETLSVPGQATARMVSAVDAARQSLANVRAVTGDIVTACVEQCRVPGEECRSCIEGNIDILTAKAGAVVGGIVSKVVGKADSAITNARNQLFSVLAEFPPDIVDTVLGINQATPADSLRGGPSIPLGPPDGHGGNSIPVSTVTVGSGTIPLGPIGGGSETLPHGSDTVPIITGGGTVTVNPPPPPPPPPPACLPYNESPSSVCTFGSCIDAAFNANGRVMWSDRLQTWVVINADGTLQLCTAVDMPPHCFGGYDGVAQFVLNNAQYGWEIRYHDVTDKNTAYAYNPIYRMVIEGNNSCEVITPQRGPCPKPTYAPAEAVLVPRDDGKAAWVDSKGTVYGEVCDLGDCSISPGTYGDYLGYFASITWIDFPDGVSGWLLPTTGFKQCSVTDATVPLTFDTAGDWIDQQDNPEQWELVYNDTQGIYSMENSETGETLSVSGQEATDNGTEESEPPPESGVLELETALPDSEYLFAGRD